ncbi:retropepsin-like aspartic protease family protein [Inhella proteolytica]|uniref:Retroviral-like aspartic protease family protein n=1 Tax=Inhella proteolytica TaxID=2795029 RepID=A0A931IYE7_9BURK|nr:retropepsin-like aspartic protease [Inhella proteolytica]MBH9575333.1 retroviral-like aspartic protease family protein [Inhella proteolytica]
MRAALLLSLLLATGAAAAPSVSLNGSLGKSAALLVIQGQVKTVRLGQTVEGVKLIEVGDDQAVVEVEGQRLQLRLGSAPVAQRAASAQKRIVLSAVEGGHFVTQGSINGHSVRFLVDTGATAVAIGIDDAKRMGLRYQNGQRIQAHTANGVTQAYVVTLDSVRIGEVEVGGVEAMVLMTSMPVALLGNSFLSRFQMKRENDILTLERRF